MILSILVYRYHSFWVFCGNWCMSQCSILSPVKPQDSDQHQISPYWDGMSGRSSSDEMSLKRCNKNHNYGQQGGE